ncbi:tRNA (uracil-5-)-methyltransferase [Raphidocelis subcapitata]|uniref:tRNA (Uracil-5-)-methyltransferase n=1 Tax=Raphidocelis subcapitata TaxID=307507 RepID=A0A2V0NP36_9CHLO|nr:tRNA (uracil-5-)-methyltransferase [Raphidocelis subcapitata]|eukprot:GBF88282.1 tRNA (uracil-5-)-methyltransferase [Raphidocelis subcapitata]
MPRRAAVTAAGAAAAAAPVADPDAAAALAAGDANVAVVRPEQYDAQLEANVARVRGLFQGFELPEPEVHRSAPMHYRQRAEFRVWHEGDACHYIMFARVPGCSTPRRFRLDSFPVGSEAMNVIMSEVMAAAAASGQLRRKLYQVNIHTTLSGEAMVALVYHKRLDEAWESEARALRARLRAALAERHGGGSGSSSSSSSSGGGGSSAGSSGGNGSGGGVVHVIGRSHKQKVALDADFVTEVLSVNGRDLAYKQVEGAFSQPNSGVSAKMLAWAQDVTRGSGGHDLLELYCGNGNFTVALAPCFRQVVATEVSKSSVEAARANLDANGAHNVFIARMSSAEFTETWRAKGTRNRLKGLAPWEELRLGTLLVDPPRAGLDDESRQLLRDFERVVYVSCNPETLARDLRSVEGSHRVERFAVFDAFPYTEHIECGAYLVRRQGGGV